MAGFAGFGSLQPCSPYHFTHQCRKLRNNVNDDLINQYVDCDMHNYYNVVLFTLTPQTTASRQYALLPEWMRITQWQLVSNTFLLNIQNITSILLNLLSVAEKWWSPSSTARSPISSMLLLLIFKTRRDFCVEK